MDDASGMDDLYNDCIRTFQASLPGLILHRLPFNSGAPRARNFGISLSSFEWIALVDDDDEWLPQKLEKQWALVKQSDKSTGLIYTWTKVQAGVSKDSYDSKHTIQGDARRAILTTNFIMSASVMVRRDAIEEADLFDVTLSSCQDWDMWVRIFSAGYYCDVVPEILTVYHQHGQPSIGNSRKAYSGHLQFLKKHWLSMLTRCGPIAILRFAMGLRAIKQRKFNEI